VITVPEAQRESKFDDGEIRVRYADGEVRANFDLRAALEEHFAARTRSGGGDGGGGLADRKRKLRRLVRLEGMTLDEARELDFDAWADDLPRLRAMRDDYLADPTHRPPIGSTFTKGVVMVCAASGHGKGVLVDETAAQLVTLAMLGGGRPWSVAMPAGRNAVEDVKGAEIVIHDDARFWLLPTHDEFLRWLDPNRATAAATRNANTPAPAPRAILLTTSNTLEEFAMTVFTRKTSADLAQNARYERGSVVIDELLRRIGWHVEIRTPEWVLEQEGRIAKPDFLALLRAEMVVSIHRMVVVPEQRQRVYARDRSLLGEAATTRKPELIAMLRGVEPAARFLAISLLSECSPDVWAGIPADEAQALGVEYQAIRVDGLQRAAGAVAA
jgi:hypothetical protein